ncbi:MAG: RagB/SusD family nutrient uptake outer membrane protein, partial [Candidatus Cryptobacteroides sp.]
MRNIGIKILSVLSASALTVSCSLDQYPHTETTAKDVYATAANYEAVLSGIYTSMIINLSSISDDDRFQNYSRALIMFQEATTDNLDNVWAAGESTTDLNNLSWTAGDPWVSAIYYHIFNIITLSNEFIRNAADSEIQRFSGEEREKIVAMRNEARGLRALAYYHALDLFPAISFVDESSTIGSYIPPVYTRTQLFDYLESELKDIAQTLPAVNYGHITSATATAILARMYLNAEVYTGEARYDDCIKACQEIFAGGFHLEDDYFKLFNADNHLRTNEIFFSLANNATYTVAWGAGTYLVCATRFDNDAGMTEEFGVATYWNCLRARPQLVDQFSDGDLRGRFGCRNRAFYDDASEDFYEVAGDTKYKYQDRPKEIIGHDETTSGFLVNKWSNITDDGQTASDTRVNGAETDMPLFRLADVNLMFAEAVLRGGQGATRSEALAKVNDVRTRAFGNTFGNITDAELTLDFILAERARELYTECTRRTDLIRFGKYTEGYNWNWKGGVKDGKDVASKYEVLPIPEAELSANPDLKA